MNKYSETIKQVPLMKELTKDIHDFIIQMNKKYSLNLEEEYNYTDSINYLTSVFSNYLNKEVWADKIWNIDDIQALIDENITLQELSDNDKQALIDETINILLNTSRINTFEDCTDYEWNVLHEALNKAAKNLELIKEEPDFDFKN